MAGPRSLLHKLFSREKTNLFDDTAAIKLPPIHFEEAKRRMQDAEVRKQTERSGKSVICVDVDGVIHSYTSGWQGATVLADPPVPGAIEALHLYLDLLRLPFTAQEVAKWVASRRYANILISTILNIRSQRLVCFQQISV